MDNNWAEVRSQLDQVLASELAHRQARRQQPSLWQALRHWRAAMLRLWLGVRRRPVRTALSATTHS
jgi:hypothetical protein